LVLAWIMTRPLARRQRNRASIPVVCVCVWGGGEKFLFLFCFFTGVCWFIDFLCVCGGVGGGEKFFSLSVLLTAVWLIIQFFCDMTFRKNVMSLSSKDKMSEKNGGIMSGTLDP